MRAMPFPASRRRRVAASDLHWPRIYALCALVGLGLGLLVIGPLCLGPRALPFPVEMHFTLHVGK